MSDLINFENKFSSFQEQWSPKIVAESNGQHFKIAKIEGEFVWHQHPDTDEVFLVMDGEMKMEFRDRTVDLKKGEMIVVPAGVEHRPRADKECQILMIENAGTVNTGDAEDTDLETTQGEWI